MSHRVGIALVAVSVAMSGPLASAHETLAGDPAIAAPLGGDFWLGRHERLAARAASERPALLFLGDSITENWSREGRAAWERWFAPLDAANFGIAGDRTQGLLWRIEHGGYARMCPRAVVLLIGTNNVKERRNSPAETAAGVRRLVDALRQQLPEAKLLLLGLLPCGEGPDTPHRRDAAEVNRLIAPLGDAFGVDYLDVGSDFLSPDGEIPARLMPDQLHPSAEGYERLARRLHPWCVSVLEPDAPHHGTRTAP